VGGTGGTGGGAGGSGGSVGGTGGSTGGAGGSGGTGGGGTGGSAGSGSIDEVPEACALLTSCTGCCVTVGAYALDTLDEDVTASRVRDLTYEPDYVITATYSFQSSGETGGIFFRLASAVTMEYLALSVGSSAGGMEAALVRSAGADGCIYPIVGSTLSATPSACWGTGAGPYYGLPVDQIEIRVRSTAAQTATLAVGEVYFY
jgi:hypothetical protein